MNGMDGGRRIGGSEANTLAGGLFSAIAVTILVFSVSIMSLAGALMLWAYSAEDLEVRKAAPGQIFFSVPSAGIFTVSAGPGAECVLSRSNTPIPLTRPGDVWFGAFSSGGVDYATHISVEGTYALACKNEKGPVDPAVAKGLAENAVWLAAWMLGLPVALMGGSLLLAWIFVWRSIPADGMEIRRTEGP